MLISVAVHEVQATVMKTSSSDLSQHTQQPNQCSSILLQLSLSSCVSTREHCILNSFILLFCEEGCSAASDIELCMAV